MPLVTGRVIIDDLTLVQNKTGLEREENRNTWSLREQPQSAADKPSRVAVRRITVDRGFLVYRDTTIQTDKEIDVAGEIGAGAS